MMGLDTLLRSYQHKFPGLLLLRSGSGHQVDWFHGRQILGQGFPVHGGSMDQPRHCLVEELGVRPHYMEYSEQTHSMSFEV